MKTAQFTYDENTFSDLHKDAYGFRPRGENPFWDATPEQKQVIWDETCRALEQSIAEEDARKAVATHSFEKSIASLIAKGAGNRATAIRWFIESTNITKSDLAYGGSYLCYEFGLPYEGYMAEFDAIIKAVSMFATNTMENTNSQLDPQTPESELARIQSEEFYTSPNEYA